MSYKLPPSTAIRDDKGDSRRIHQTNQQIEREDKRRRRNDTDQYIVGGADLWVGTGANDARRVTNNLLAEHNVKDYGALGDGSTDDVSAIQAAIDAVSDEGGGTVWVPDGNYAVSDTITLKNNVYLKGSSRNGSVITSTNTAGAHMVVMEDTSANPSHLRGAGMEHLFLQGNPACGDGFRFGGDMTHFYMKEVHIDLVGGAGLRFAPFNFLMHFDGVRIRSAQSYGFYNPAGTSINNIIFTNCFAAGCVDNWRFESITQSVVFNQCAADQADDHGFYFPTAGRAVLIGCSAEQNTNRGFRFGGTGRYVAISCRTGEQPLPYSITGSCDVMLIHPESSTTPSGNAFEMTSAATGNNLLIAPSFDRAEFVDAAANLVRINGTFVDVEDEFRVNGTKVVGTRQTGWSPPAGTETRASFNTSTVTLSQLAERVHALIDDLTTHGLIG